MSSIRDQIAAKRAAATKFPTSSSQTSRSNTSKFDPSSSRSNVSNDGVLEDRTFSSQIKKAARNGKLDISDFELKRIPTEVYTTILGIEASSLSRPATPPATTVSRTNRRDIPESEELISFKASSNQIEELEKEIGGFGGLKSFEIRSNRLTRLPDSFADLLRLTSIDLSQNSFTAIPPAVLLLPALQTLDLSHNSIRSIDLSSPVSPSEEGLSYGAGFLSTSFSRQNKISTTILPALRSLNLAYNKIDNDGLAGLKIKDGFKSLKILNLEGNSLSGELDVDVLGLGTGNTPELGSLNLASNRGLRGTIGTLSKTIQVNLDGNDVAQQLSAFNIEGNVNDEVRAKMDSRSKGNGSGSPSPTTTMVYRTCPAATFDSEPLKIDFDLYLPPEPPSNPVGSPLIIWFHGGGLLQGNKENLPPHFRRLPTHSFPSPHNGKPENVAVISPNYRLAPQVPILDILSDVTELLKFVKNSLNTQLEKSYPGHKVDTNRICLSGGSAGGYLALIAGMNVPRELSDEDVGGYRGEEGVKCIAPFYPITDLTDPFWSTETNPVPWFGRTVTHAEAKPHIDTKAAPVCTAKSGGPRSILYMYMLQHSLFPSLLFQTQRSVGRGANSFRPTPESLSITHRLELVQNSCARSKKTHIPIYLIYGTADDKVQPFGKTLDILRRSEGELEVVELEGVDHGFDEDEREECLGFRDWVGKWLI